MRGACNVTLYVSHLLALELRVSLRQLRVSLRQLLLQRLLVRAAVVQLAAQPGDGGLGRGQAVQRLLRDDGQSISGDEGCHGRGCQPSCLLLQEAHLQAKEGLQIRFGFRRCCMLAVRGH